MDDGMVFVMINLFAFVLPIVFVGIWTSHKKDMLKLNMHLSDSEKQNMTNELTAVKAQLEVLEAIVTDKKYHLAQEITALKSVE
jgi:hypothetical protein